MDDEETEDLLRAVEGELASRRYGDAVRLETTLDCPAHLRDFLLEHFELGPDDHYAVDGPVNLNRLATIPDLVDRRDLKYQPFVPAVSAASRRTAGPVRGDPREGRAAAPPVPQLRAR